MNVIDRIIKFLTLEFILDHHPNGGTVVLVRSIWCSVVVYALTVFLVVWIDPDLSPADNTTMYTIREKVVETIPWYGAILAALYTAFYSRFSAQWSYLANLYNQIKAVESNSPTATALVEWKSGFLEDCDEVHLLRKPIMAAIVVNWGKDPKVKESFIKEWGSQRFLKILYTAKQIKYASDIDYNNVDRIGN